ncbi:MAG: glycyl-radical enzyme activating protein, partial [bacterium]|nr:glycyl-radical enzyme activating protein [bacterium]
MTSDVKGRIFDIQHFSIHDGPGIRTTVFFKGCPLSCLWCHNPESIDFQPEIAFYQEFCIDCKHCLEVCPNQCHQFVDGTRVFHRERCTGCGRCAEECCAEALVLKGKEYTIAEVLAEVEKDVPFYTRSGGGLTVSGGEPLAQSGFCLELLKQAKQRGLHTVVDTSGYVPWKTFQKALEWSDLFLFDVKANSAELHTRLTGVENIRITENLQKLLECNASVIVRIPLIPGYNDAPSEMVGIAETIATFTIPPPVHILPYHQFAEQKYRPIGREYTLKERKPTPPEYLKQLGQIFEKRGLVVDVKGLEN